ncbi:MAG: hypothetical protein QOJ50_1478 [Cryptosporangiaceae bacterium]|nr:hypothetical protein [Cryptosporangiaceae bacterium]
MSGTSTVSRTRKFAAVASVAAMIGGGFAVYAGVSNAAGEDCGGLNTALQNNLNFIAGQRANPDALSTARIANRQAVVDLINQRRAAAGCGGAGNAAAPAGNAQGAAQGNAQPQGSGENCGGLDQALKNNQNFIAGQQANPDAQSAARIANRQAVINLIQQRRAAAGCTGGGNAAPAAPPAAAPAAPPAAAPPAAGNNAGGNNNAGNNAAAGQQVCNGSTVTLSGEAGAPAASSGTFPVGTTLSVLNLDNNKSTTVKVTSASGSCVLLNNAAFEQVREAGKFLIRHAVIRKVG